MFGVGLESVSRCDWGSCIDGVGSGDDDYTDDGYDYGHDYGDDNGGDSG